MADARAPCKNGSWGIATFKPDMYREVAEDPDAMGMALLITAGVSAIVGFVSGLLQARQLVNLMQDPNFRELGIDPAVLSGVGAIGLAMFGLIVSPISALIGLVIGSAIFALVANTFFGGEATTGKLMRVFGFAYIFQILGIIPCLGTLAAFVLGIIGSVLSIREGSRIGTGGAIVTYILPSVILFALLFCAIFGIILLAGAAASA
ncbi:MAG: hypothetical protein HC893_06580 [Chloroflexaceae bacterium]|nr:hypothetical protein [Chloroflexaceae bacterium]